MSMYVSDVAEVGRLVGGDRTKPLILYCNGPFCGKSKRLSEELLAAGFTNVRRYQLGIPVWRALVGLTEIELPAVPHVFQKDRTAVFRCAGRGRFGAGSLPGAHPQACAGQGRRRVRTKDDGRPPMEDHNTRIVVFGREAPGRAHCRGDRPGSFTTSYFPGTFDALRSAVK
jgi:hypothetical protein